MSKIVKAKVRGESALGNIYQTKIAALKMIADRDEARRVKSAYLKLQRLSQPLH